MTNEEKIQIGFCWYQPEQWKQLREVVPDPESLDATYDEWKKSATVAINNLKAEGLSVKKVSINIKALITWCSEKGLEPISSSRSEYAAFKLQSRGE